MTQVNLAKNTQTGQEYAIKIMYKEHLRRHNKVNMAFVEKDALIKIQAAGGHPGIVRLERTWQDNWSFCTYTSPHAVLPLTDALQFMSFRLLAMVTFSRYFFAWARSAFLARATMPHSWLTLSLSCILSMSFTGMSSSFSPLVRG